MEAVSNQLLGQNGSIDLDSGEGVKTYAGKDRPVALQAINGAAVTFTTITDDRAQGATDILASIGAGATIYGTFSAITVATGAVRCYLG